MNMNLDDLKEKLINMIEPLISDLGMELVDVELKRSKGRMFLRVFIDREGGVTIDDCESASHEIEALLDVEDPIPSSYVLEVSSPGLDRPLKKPADFKRFCGNTVRIVTTEPVDGQTFFVGKIDTASDDSVVLLLPKDRKVKISYNVISRARLEVEV
jgi:ribosome maturation factor RimP